MLAAFTDALIRNNPSIIYTSNTVYLLLDILLILETHCNSNITFIAYLLRTYTAEESDNDSSSYFKKKK